MKKNALNNQIIQHSKFQKISLSNIQKKDINKKTNILNKKENDINNNRSNDSNKIQNNLNLNQYPVGFFKKDFQTKNNQNKIKEKKLNEQEKKNTNCVKKIFILNFLMIYQRHQIKKMRKINKKKKRRNL